MAGSKISISIWNVGWILHRVGLKTLVNICPEHSAALKYLPAMWQESIPLLCFQSYLRSEVTVSTTLPDLTLRSSRITQPLSQPPKGSGFKLAQRCLWFHHQPGDSTDATSCTWQDGKEMKQRGMIIVPWIYIALFKIPKAQSHTGGGKIHVQPQLPTSTSLHTRQSGGSALPKDTTTDSDRAEFGPPTLRLLDDPLYPLSHSHPH